MITPALVYAQLRGPRAAFFACALLYGLADSLSGDYFGSVAAPTIAAWNPRLSKLLFFTACLIVLECSRRWPRARDHVNVALGVGWTLLAFGYQYAIAMFLVAIVVYAVAHRLNPYLAFVMVGLLLFAVYETIGAPWREPYVRGPRTAAVTMLALGMNATRMMLYAFEAGSIRKANRSFLGLLAYSPFSILLYPGEAFLLSYITYRAKRPQAELDLRGANALYRSGAKILSVTLLAQVIHHYLPHMSGFFALPWAGRVAIAVLMPVTWFLKLSAIADFCTGISNLCGYHAPDTFEWPLLARTPFEFWRTWNIHVVNFIKVSCIYPMARRRRSLLMMILSVWLGTVAIHVALRIGLAGLGWVDQVESHYDQITASVVIPLSLVIGLPFEIKKTHFGPVGPVITLALVVFMCFANGMNDMYLGTQPWAPGTYLHCQLLSIFNGGKACYMPGLVGELP